MRTRQKAGNLVGAVDSTLFGEPCISAPGPGGPENCPAGTSAADTIVVVGSSSEAMSSHAPAYAGADAPSSAKATIASGESPPALSFMNFLEPFVRNLHMIAWLGSEVSDIFRF